MISGNGAIILGLVISMLSGSDHSVNETPTQQSGRGMCGQASIEGLPFLPAPLLKGELPLHITADWTITIGPGAATIGNREINLSEAIPLQVSPLATVEVRGEQHAAVPVFNPYVGGWVKGLRLRNLIAWECTATGLLLPETLTIRPISDSEEPFTAGQDYLCDPFWATFGRVEGGGILADQSVLVDYDYVPCRIDSIVVSSTGTVKIIEGAPGTAVVRPPHLSAGDTLVANIYQAGKAEGLTDANLFPLQPLDAVVSDATGSQAERFLPRTLEKLRAGEEITILAWGDSVTTAQCGLNNTDHQYQKVFVSKLRERYPKATINLITEAWGGRTSGSYLDAEPGSGKNFEEQVLAIDADLITIEFVNDACLAEEQVEPHYDRFIPRLREKGAEIVLITPHLVRPDMMGVTSMKFDQDPRPYVKGLRQYAKEHQLALADASQVWCQLWHLGLPYLTLEGNWINHPDERGHLIFARQLIGLFPPMDPPNATGEEPRSPEE